MSAESQRFTTNLLYVELDREAELVIVRPASQSQKGISGSIQLEERYRAVRVRVFPGEILGFRKVLRNVVVKVESQKVTDQKENTQRSSESRKGEIPTELGNRK